MQKIIANVGSTTPSGNVNTGSGATTPTPSSTTPACQCRRLQRWREDVLAKLAEPGIEKSREEKLRRSLRTLNNRLWQLRCEESGRLPAHLQDTAIETEDEVMVLAGCGKTAKIVRFKKAIRSDRHGDERGDKLNKPVRGIRSPAPIDLDSIVTLPNPKMVRAAAGKAKADERRYEFYALDPETALEIQYGFGERDELELALSDSTQELATVGANEDEHYADWPTIDLGWGG